MSIVINFVYIQDQKLIANRLGNVGNIFLNTDHFAKKNVCFYLIQFLKSFNLNYENCKFSGWSNLFIRTTLFTLQHEISRAYNRRFTARIALKMGENLTKNLCISLSTWKMCKVSIFDRQSPIKYFVYLNLMMCNILFNY